MFDKEMENSLQALFMRITHRYFVKTYNQMMNLGIHPGQVPMLRLLDLKKGLTQKEIAEKLNIRPPTVNVTIRRLEKSELVCRKENEKDRRSSLVFLTEKGQELTTEIKKVMKKNEDIMFRGFSETEQSLLRRFFKDILGNLAQIEVEEKKERRHD